MAKKKTDKKKTEPFKMVYNGWVPGDETLKDTLLIADGSSFSATLYRTMRECLENRFGSAIRRRITVIIEDV